MATQSLNLTSEEAGFRSSPPERETPLIKKLLKLLPFRGRVRCQAVVRPVSLLGHVPGEVPATNLHVVLVAQGVVEVQLLASLQRLDRSLTV